MFINRKEYERLVEENEELKERYDELRFRVISSTHFLDDFEYAVLKPKNSYTLRVWNQGRFEEKVVSVEVSQGPDTMPYFRIEK